MQKLRAIFTIDDRVELGRLEAAQERTYAHCGSVAVQCPISSQHAPRGSNDRLSASQEVLGKEG